MWAVARGLLPVDTAAIRRAAVLLDFASRSGCISCSFTIVNYCFAARSEEKHQGVITVTFDIV
jgi:hypothetical protein